MVAPGALFAVVATAAWFFPRQVLCVDSGEVKADVLVLLGGGGIERPDRAVQLFHAHEASVIICSGFGDCDSNKLELHRNGISDTAISTERLSHNTSENARFCIPLLRALGARRVIIVTTWYHSRRALRCFEHYAPDIQFFSRPAYLGYDAKDRGAVRRYINLEYPKLLGYWLRYGVCPIRLKTSSGS